MSHLRQRQTQVSFLLNVVGRGDVDETLTKVRVVVCGASRLNASIPVISLAKVLYVRAGKDLKMLWGIRYLTVGASPSDDVWVE